MGCKKYTNTVYRVLKAMLNYCDFPDLKQIAVKRMRFHGGIYRVVYGSMYTQYQCA